MNSIYNNNFLYFQEDGHKYNDTYGNEYTSVTTIIGDYAPKIDKKYWQEKIGFQKAYEMKIKGFPITDIVLMGE